MQAFLIDPVAKTVTPVEYSGNFHDIYKLTDCDTFDVARLNHGDGIYIDDDGLFKDNQSFFVHADYPQPLAGKGLVLGVDDQGDSAAPVTTLAELIDKVVFVTPMRVPGSVIWVETT